MAFNQFLFIHETIHLVTSGIVGIFLWKIFRNKTVLFIAIISGIFIDSDHLIDFFLDYLNIFGPIFDLGKLTSFLGDYMRTAGKVYVLFHSLDFIWVWWLIGWYLSSRLRVRGMEWALALPMIVHILIDQASYMPHPLAYFLLFRLSHGFGLDSFNGL